LIGLDLLECKPNTTSMLSAKSQKGASVQRNYVEVFCVVIHHLIITFAHHVLNDQSNNYYFTILL